MSKHCRFCGGKVMSDATECKHCGKTLVKKENDEKIGLTNINSWEGKAIPAWVMILVVAFFIFCFVVMCVKGCEEPPAAAPNSAETTTSAE